METQVVKDIDSEGGSFDDPRWYIHVAGETYNRVEMGPDGIFVGDGTAAPTAISLNSDGTATLGGLTIPTGKDVTIATSGNGTKIGQTNSKIGFAGATPVALPRSAYTQTYATADKTHANPTASAIATTSATNSAPYGYSQAQADAIVAAINALVIDVADVKQLANSVIDDLQAIGLVG